MKQYESTIGICMLPPSWISLPPPTPIHCSSLIIITYPERSLYKVLHAGQKDTSKDFLTDWLPNLWAHKLKCNENAESLVHKWWGLLRWWQQALEKRGPCDWLCRAMPMKLIRAPCSGGLLTLLFLCSLHPRGTFIPSFIIEFVFSVPSVVRILNFAFLSILDSYVA